MPPDPPLSQIQRAFLETARRATLATIDGAGVPRLVPVCFVVDPTAAILYSPLDDKPKRTDDPLTLARVRDIRARPDVSILVDRWDEDWSRLAWLRCHGRADLLEAADANHAAMIAALRAKYPQYAGHRLEERPLIRVVIERATSWGALGE
jgi:PPOX class probable F420-dependent enzyme